MYMASSSRFSEVEEGKITEIIDAAIPENTKRQTYLLMFLFSFFFFFFSSCLLYVPKQVGREAIARLLPALNSN